LLSNKNEDADEELFFLRLECHGGFPSSYANLPIHQCFAVEDAYLRHPQKNTELLPTSI